MWLHTNKKMFDRKKYKKFARMQLKNRWTIPVVMTLITSSIIMLLQSNDFFNMFRTFTASGVSLGMSSIFFIAKEPHLSLFSSLFDWLAILIEFILIFANIAVFLKMSRGPEPVQFGTFMEGLSNWGRAALGGLWQLLWTFLWSLLFIIPGIVKYYAYSQMFWLLAEFPNLSVTKSMKISKEITNGHKGDLFIMDLSFLGWAILASIPAFIGWLWLMPYILMSKTNAYHALLKEAIDLGKLKAEDFKD